ncbi:hypothetical protein GUO98_002831 [Salmonella enterica]|nr:hypothetical protein [Salmonella enterica]
MINKTDTIHLFVRDTVIFTVNLHAMVKLGRFRQDLYYRINALALIILPLRERAEDIPLLLSYFLDKYGREFNCKISLDQKLINHIYHYPWPGNVRELERYRVRHLITSASAADQTATWLPAPGHQSPELNLADTMFFSDRLLLNFFI